MTLPNELYLERLYDAPLARVWQAWTDPAETAQWWGPRGFTLTTHQKDVRTGGSWSYTMHGPDGVDYLNKTAYLEVEENSRLVYDHGGNDDRPPLFRVDVVFSEHLDKTKMQMTMIFPTQEAAQNAKIFIKQANGDTTWDRLGEYLEKKLRGKDVFIINRSFSAPLEVMFEMWTNPRHFSQWIPPTGFSMQFIRADIRPGGSTFYMMTDGESMKMYGRAKYLEITKPHRLVYTQEFCDENENISRHPLAPVWPETMLSTVTLTEEGPAQTRVTVFWETHGQTTPQELETFIAARAGMTQGWSGSFEKLEKYLT